MAKLQDKVALITGAGSGMGRSQAVLFAQEGVKVIAADINMDNVEDTVKMIKADGGEALAIHLDVSQQRSVNDAVKKGIDMFGRIHILSNTAGILDGYSATLDTSEELWDRIMNINLKGVYYMTNAVLPHMLKHEEGVIVNIGSIASFVAGGGGAAYTSAKHAIAGYTKQLSFDYGQKGIRANAIAPGAVETGMTKQIFAEGSAAVMEAVNSVPAGRYGQPEEIASVALFLASDDASFMHGAIVPVDGGWTVK
ncbi:3-oxoacyl-ACP reductase [Salisediminibacterium halotolerans]|uniref:3-oxoacyl-[acyl-carrier protein] reductase n=1 Tax=Salisediminibacterium halotolerans TaxID=517425 RepID=A0A1H9T1W0_9BACI|nr:3-oxoacyl-ACP reductase [Salisediminibacterium haloalkalitolerans]SER90699.1 3-oxoacyl-[acyl-carrier protein] reductase [Salisediminibacterium haloalkalitolerans]